MLRASLGMVGMVWGSTMVSAVAQAETRSVPVRRAPSVALLEVLGDAGSRWAAPQSAAPALLVELAPGQDARALGLEPVAPGVGRLRAGWPQVRAFAAEHPGLRMEVAPPLRPLLDHVGRAVRAPQVHSAGFSGAGVAVGVVDTGIDPNHPDFLDELGRSRVRWVLDFSLPPQGLHPELEARFAAVDGNSGQRFGAVFSGEDLDRLRAAGEMPVRDEVGHGTHVASIAAGNGGLGAAESAYVGMAPKATLMVVRAARSAGAGIENDDVLRGVAFLYERAEAERMPCVVNLSLGGDFGAHDGSSLWESVLTSHVGEDKPGRVLIAAAGNSGAAPEQPIHQSVRVSSGARTLVPIHTVGGAGTVSVWLNFRNDRGLKVGLRSPDGMWVDPVLDGEAVGKNTERYNAGVVNGAAAPASPLRPGSRGAVLAWDGQWPTGRYDVVLEGDGDVELYLQSHSAAGREVASFYAGQRAGTINVPAAHPAVIAVGCTVSRPHWRSVGGLDITVRAPTYDPAGGIPTGAAAAFVAGDICYFSSAGPNANGVPKPEIVAPGALVAAAMSEQALPSSSTSMFDGSRCPSGPSGVETTCMQVDARHAISSGTSMSAPVVSGAVALLLARDPSLTQAQVSMLLQAGAQRPRGAVPFAVQAGPGELDVLGLMTAWSRWRQAETAPPQRDRSWLATSHDHLDAEGLEPLTVLIELRDAAGEPADGFATSRLTPWAEVNGAPLATRPIERLGPGLFRYLVYAPAGLGGQFVELGARFDGEPVVSNRRLPIALDAWRAGYGAQLGAGCSQVPGSRNSSGWIGLGVCVAMLAWRRVARRSA